MEEIRTLEVGHRDRLGLIEEQYPEATVIDWHNKDSKGRYGPVVWFPQQQSSRVVNHTGRLFKRG